MYFKECNMNINQFDITVNVLYVLVEKEFSENPQLKDIISYEDILKIFTRTSALATVYQIPIEDYIKLVIQQDGDTVCEISNNFLDEFNNIIKEYNSKLNEENQITYCQDIIGKRNAMVLHIMLSEFYQ